MFVLGTRALHSLQCEMAVWLNYLLFSGATLLAHAWVVPNLAKGTSLSISEHSYPGSTFGNV